MYFPFNNFGCNVLVYNVLSKIILTMSDQVRYGSTCRHGTSPRSPICSTPSAYSGRPPGPAPGPLTTPSYDHPTALTTTSWDAPSGDSTLHDTLHLGCDEQDHPIWKKVLPNDTNKDDFIY